MAESTEEKALGVESPAATFEQNLTNLELVVKQLESGDLPLEDALLLFERGIGLSESCKKQLEQAETKVEQLIKRNGRMEPEPFPNQ